VGEGTEVVQKAPRVSEVFPGSLLLESRPVVAATVPHAVSTGEVHVTLQLESATPASKGEV
jgi:hypothetical protein